MIAVPFSLFGSYPTTDAVVCHKGVDGVCATFVAEQKVECAGWEKASGAAIEEAVCRGKDPCVINDNPRAGTPKHYCLACQ